MVWEIHWEEKEGGREQFTVRAAGLKLSSNF